MKSNRISRIISQHKVASIFFLSLTIFLALYFYEEAATILFQKKLSQLKCANCNVILIGVDTLRADHLGSYGYFRDTSPNIDKFAENGVIFKNAFSASSKTTPSFMSMLTSLYPPDHGILNVLNADDKGRKIFKINDQIITLAQIFKNQGYFTQAFITSEQLPPELGFNRGFDNFSQSSIGIARQNFLNWLEKNKHQKFFVFFHDIEPHSPYVPPAPYDKIYDPDYQGVITTENSKTDKDISLKQGQTVKESLEKLDIKRDLRSQTFWSKVNPQSTDDINHLTALYDGEIKHMDEFIGRLQEILRSTGLSSNTIIVFTADHGEEFMEHGQFEHNQLYSEILHVPMIINHPKITDKIEINSKVRAVDIFPTILDILSIKIKHPIRGTSLLPAMVNPQASQDLPVIATQYQNDRAFVKQDYKYMLQGKKEYLFNLSVDAVEQTNLLNEKQEQAKKMKSELEELLKPGIFYKQASEIDLQLSPRTIEQLRDLGYGNP